MTELAGPASGASPALSIRRSRRLGGGLIAFGLAGLLLVGAAAAMVLGSLNAVGAAVTGFEEQRDQIVSMLGPAASALENAAASAENAGSSLVQTTAAARDAAELTTRLAESFEGMAALGSFSVFGARPFAGVAGQFAAVGVEARQLSGNLTLTADSMATNVSDSQAVAFQLRALATQLEDLRDGLATDGSGSAGGSGGAGTELPLGLAAAVLVGLLAWFAVIALASIWLGFRLLRAPDGVDTSRRINAY